MPRLSPGESRQSPGRAPVYRNSAGITGAIPASDPGRATETPRFTPGRRRQCPGGAPVNAGGVPAERRFTYVP
ncbi:hypothetical protein DPMN_084742 [Dreissena polymorpha]|uniref:Uncharacterized protein n=1 Tax=Dreissena polymorpha TaxID=45954 RepID=A0A9D3YBI7_DREPO|nr:hypothetical protein DPMN_084742 [Dreissena polymorpha]